MSELTDEQRTILLAPCACGHTLNDHGSMTACWVCEDDGTECATNFETLLLARVGDWLDAERARAEAAEAKVARVEAMLVRAEHSDARDEIDDTWAATKALRAALADPETAEGVGTGADEGATGQDTGTAWVTRSADYPKAPAQAHPLGEHPETREA